MKKAFVLIAILLACGNGEKQEIKSMSSQVVTIRKPPIVYYWGDVPNVPGATIEYDTNETSLNVEVTQMMPETFLLMLSEGEEIEIWRVEWCPVGDSCYSPIYYGMIPPHGNSDALPHSGIVYVKIFGLQLGDKLMFWRSYPWPGYENTPEVRDSVCMIPVR